jgi:hypothetical protein
MASDVDGRASFLGSVAAKTMRDQRRSLPWWAGGFVLVVLTYSAFWPNVRENARAFTAYLDDMPEFVKNMIGGIDFTTPEGYVQSELFSFMVDPPARLRRRRARESPARRSRARSTCRVDAGHAPARAARQFGAMPAIVGLIARCGSR